MTHTHTHTETHKGLSTSLFLLGDLPMYRALLKEDQPHAHAVTQ